MCELEGFARMYIQCRNAGFLTGALGSTPLRRTMWCMLAFSLRCKSRAKAWANGPV